VKNGGNAPTPWRPSAAPDSIAGAGPNGARSGSAASCRTGAWEREADRAVAGGESHAYSFRSRRVMGPPSSAGAGSSPLFRMLRSIALRNPAAVV